MAGSVNKVILVGNVGRDPEVRSLQDGSKVVNFSVATSETWNDRASGERKERTEWHRVVVFNDRIADVVEKYVRKGKSVYVEGALQTRKYTDQSGVEKSTTEIVISRFRGELTLLGGRGDAGGGGDADMGEERGGYQAPRRAPARAESGHGGGGGASWDAPRGGAGGGHGDLDDEIPF
jgi:single-strand DNA-binding protein